jgi:preprotein translocase subunit SecE
VPQPDGPHYGSPWKKSSKMSKVKAYIQDSYNELINKVSWPTWPELQSSAIVVLVASLIIGFMVFGMDSIFQFIMNLLYSTF